MCMEAGRQAGRGRAGRHTIGCSLICVSIISSFYVMGGIIPRFLCIKVDPCVLPGFLLFHVHRWGCPYVSCCPFTPPLPQDSSENSEKTVRPVQKSEL